MLTGLKLRGTRPRPAVARRLPERLAGKTLFGETPNSTRGDAYVPRTYRKPWPQCGFRKIISENCSIWAGNRHSKGVSRFLNLPANGRVANWVGARFSRKNQDLSTNSNTLKSWFLYTARRKEGADSGSL
jgi:hypothetical protein